MDSIQTRLENAKLASAIDNACATLPGHTLLSLVMERGVVHVTLDVDGVDVDFPSNRESLAESIDDAVRHAVAIGQRADNAWLNAGRERLPREAQTVSASRSSHCYPDPSLDSGEFENISESLLHSSAE